MATTSRGNLRWVPAALLVLTLLFLGITALGGLPSDSRFCRGSMLLFGLFALSGVLIRPAWFWNSRRARWGRAALGDRLYAALLSGVALFLVYIGIYGTGLEGCSIS
jgi:hypothetical protein